ncbi:MAG TPA: hypothetical protein VEC11_05390 [Allosphingosinicella sp.]|nr:hypothetical protein [Allosphingosinicella sp.]
MKMLVAVALVATSFPVVTTAAAAAGGNDSSANERRVCTQPARARAGSRMSPRRVCRTEAQWRDALGPDWRQLLSGRTLEGDQDLLGQRSSPNVDHRGVQGLPVGHPSRGLGPN